MDLFLSYKAEDQPRVAPLVEALEAEGFSVWWDAFIGAGDDWRGTILKNLEAARCVIVVWSRRSVGPKGEFVRDEATRARKRGTYLPIRIDKVDPPLGFGETQALDLAGWKGDRSDTRYQALVASLQGRLGIATPRKAAASVVQSDRRTLLIGGATAGIALVGAGSWAFFRSRAARADSIAVLPFANLSGDPRQDYFSDGIAEELRSALARVAGLKVVGRTSSEALRDADAETAARKLNVASILTGSVRRSPSTIRVGAQLVDGKTGLERWSENYDRAPGDVIKIQTDIAENVARALAVALAGAAQAAFAIGGTQNPAAQNLLLKALALAQGGGKEDLLAAGTLVDEALKLDPNYADAYVAKARGLSWYGGSFANAAELPAYREAAFRSVQQALRIAPDLPAAHAALGDHYRLMVEFKAADREFRRALELAPGHPTALRDYAQFTSKLGHAERGRSLVEQAFALDPLNPESFRAFVDVLTANRDYAGAVHQARELQRTMPSEFHLHLELAYCLILLGRLDEARTLIAEASLPGRSFGESLLAARTGNRAEAEAKVAELRSAYGDAASYQYAQTYAQLRDADAAFAALDRALHIRDPGLLWARVDAMLDPIRSDVRFGSFFRRIGFPD